MRDRRGSPRHACRIACQLQVGKQRHTATLVDVSSSGLSIRVGVELAQAEPVELIVDTELHIRAIAWRTSRTRSGFLVGMMLSEVSPAYEALVARADRGPRPAAAADAVQPATAKPDPPATEPWWRLRVKECDGPRTRNVTLCAATRERAIERAVAEIGPGWEVLEVRPAAPADRTGA